MTGQRATIVLTITFHAPFRVSTGQAGGGLDATVDLSDPLPGSSLKGAMRDAARSVLQADPLLVDEVFGTPRTESPWAWTSAEPSGGAWDRTSVQARVAIDERSHTARRDMLAVSEVVEHSSATARVIQRRAVDTGRRAAHLALIRASAAAVHHIGSDRRRGLGWVEIRPDQAITAEDLSLIDGGPGNA